MITLINDHVNDNNDHHCVDSMIVSLVYGIRIGELMILDFISDTWGWGNSNGKEVLFQVGFLSGLSMFSPGQALLSIGGKNFSKDRYKSCRVARHCHGGHGLPDSWSLGLWTLLVSTRLSFPCSKVSKLATPPPFGQCSVPGSGVWTFSSYVLYVDVEVAFSGGSLPSAAAFQP